MEREGEGQSTAEAGSRLLAHGPLRPLLTAGYGLYRGRPRAPGEAILVKAGQTWDVTGRLGEISVPVLVTGGDRDPIIPPDLLHATANGIRDSRLIIFPGRGHVSALFDPRLKPAIEAFLNSAE